MKQVLRFVSLLVLFLTVSCMDNKKPSLTLAPSTATVNAGGAAVPFKATLENTTGDVSWTLGPSLGTLSSSTGLEISYTPPASVTTQTDVILTASVGSLSAKAIITLKPNAQSVTIIGKVLTFGGDPGASLPVLVGGQKASTDANGNFSVAGVTTPYDLTILEASRNRATIFQGLTRLEPIVFIPGPGNNENKTDVTLNFSNLDTTPPSAGLFKSGYASCASTEGYNLQCIAGLDPTTTQITWAGKDRIRTTFFAFQALSNPQGVIQSYLKFGKSENESLANGLATSVNIALEPVVNKTLGGSVSIPPGYLLFDRGLGFKISDVHTSVISREYNLTGLTPDFTWASPDIPGVKLSLYATARKGAATVSANLEVAPDNTGLELNLPTPIELSQPADKKLGVTNSTVFSWTPFAEGVYGVYVFSQEPNTLFLTIYTSTSQTTLPDLSALGFPLPKGINYGWYVFGEAPLTSVDELADGVKGIPTFPHARMAISEQRTFTTIP